jgi:NADH-quinone oxidoreductase subunit N
MYNFYFFAPEIYILFCLCFNLLFFVFSPIISNRCLFPLVVYQIIFLFFLVVGFCFFDVGFCFFIFDLFEISSQLFFFKLLLLILLFFHLFFFFYYSKYNFIALSEIVLLLQLILFIAFVLLSVSNGLTIYLCIEALGLSFFLLTGVKNYSSLSIEAAIKYFFVGVLGSSLLLLSFFCFNHNFGFFIDEYHVIGCFFFSFALLIKIGIPPFHFWVPDVYQGAPFPSMSLFTTFAKVVYFIFFFKQFLMMNSISFFLYDLLFFSANFYFCIFFLLGLVTILSLFIGNLNALVYTRIKKFLSFSSISNGGIVLIPFLLSVLNLTESSIQTLFLFLFFYVFIVLNINHIFLVLRRNSVFSLKLLSDLKSLLNLYDSFPFISILLFITFMSLAGLPPLNGFFAKFFVFFHLIFNIFFFENYFFVFLSLCLLLFSFVFTSILGIFYYIRFVRFVFFNRTKQRFFFVQIRAFEGYLLAFLTIFNFYFFFFPALPWLGSFNFSFFFLSSIF